MTTAVATLIDAWRAAWPEALRAWSPYTRLQEPRWCTQPGEAAAEGLTGSFAMIRLDDHRVVIDLAEVARCGLDGHALAVLAHEVGHHVLAPGDLRDHVRLAARVRAGLPGLDHWVAAVANLWTDLLINDRLQRQRGIAIADVYRALGAAGAGDRPWWRLYLRITERLWGLRHGTLADDGEDARLDLDASLGAAVVRTYARDQLAGAGRFACLFFPWLAEEPAGTTVRVVWSDVAIPADAVPDGLASVDNDEAGAAVHPAEDPAIAGEGADGEGTGADGIDRERLGGTKRVRPPGEYVAVLRAAGVAVEERELVMRYYRELALPHLVPFPSREVPRAVDPLPEGLESWDAGSPLQEVDWIETVARGGVVLPGITTVRRTWGESPGGEPRHEPLDLYLGIDCSGSMGNPKHHVSHPVVAGAVIALSALRRRAAVWACLSGEPGSFTDTGGWVRSERAVLATLTDYLGTGYSFGIDRLDQAFLQGAPPERPVHLLVVSDHDWFAMLTRGRADGWEVARRSAAVAGGGATAVLQIDLDHHARDVARLRACGWEVHAVTSQEEMVAFARAFSRRRYGDPHDR